MENKILDFNNLLAIRNQLAALSGADLQKLYQDENSYLAFLDAFIDLTENDSGFLLLSDEFLDKVLVVLQVHRFDMKQEEVHDTINDIITYVNSVRCYSDTMKKAILDAYVSYQEEQRKAVFGSLNELITSLSYDAVVFTMLREGRGEEIEEEDYFLMSLNYLMNVCPEFFQDSSVNQEVSTLLDKIGSKQKMFHPKKKYVKQIKEDFKNITKKEE